MKRWCCCCTVTDLTVADPSVFLTGAGEYYVPFFVIVILSDKQSNLVRKLCLWKCRLSGSL